MLLVESIRQPVLYFVNGTNVTFIQDIDTGFKKTIQGVGVVDSTGTCRIAIPPAASGTIETGSVTIYDSPGSAIWMKVLNGQIVDTVVGQSTCGNIQVNGADVLEFVTTGLTGFVTTPPTSFHATFFCVVTREAVTNLVIPGHDSLPSIQLPPRQIINGVNYTASGGPAHTFNIPLLTSDQSLLIGVGTGSGPAVFTVTGNQTQIAYVVSYQLYGGQCITIPAYGGLDTTVQVQITGITSNAIVTIAGMPNFAQVGSAVQPIMSADGLGTYSNITQSLAAGTEVAILPTLALPLMYRIGSILVSAPTTVAGTVTAGVRVSGGAFITRGYSAVGGLILSWFGSITFSNQLNGFNQTAVAASVDIYYRTEIAS